jgi:exoribonuclease R
MSPLAMHLSTVEAEGELAAALSAIPTDLGLARNFSADVLAEAEKIATTVALPDVDQTDIPFVTIDPAGSMDLDQAMFLAREGSGYRAQYAIANVPAFVMPGGALDLEARKRGQTIYAPDGRIPLHPTILSEGAASLLPGQVRGAFVWDFTLDSEANVTRSSVGLARVMSREQLTYVDVQKAIDTGTASDVTLLLREIGLKRIVLEQQRGGASLSTPETDVESHGASYELVRRQPLPVENWNAQISLMTGMAAADLMLKGGVGILRTMPPADEQSIDKFRRQAAALGHPWPSAQPYGDYLRGIDTVDPRQLAIMHAAGSLFRGAGYMAFHGVPTGQTNQAAVGAPYAHATAPLRRLVDRFVLVVCEALSNGHMPPAWVTDALPTLPPIMARSTNISAELDHRALDTVEAAVLSTHIGETFDATVLSATPTDGMIQVISPPVAARCAGQLTAGEAIRARLVSANIATGTVAFTLT